MEKLKFVGRFLTTLVLVVVLSVSSVLPAHAVAWEAVAVEAVLGGVIESLVSAAITAASDESTATQKSNAKAICNRYWRNFSDVPPDEDYDIQVSADVLADIAAELCLAGFPCQVVSYNGNYYIKGVGSVYIPDVIDYSDRNGFGGDQILIYGKYFSHEGLYYYSTTMPSSYLLNQIRTTLTNISSAITSMSNRLLAISDSLTTIDTKLTDLSDDVNAMRDYLSMIAGTGNNSWLQQIRDKLTSAITELTTVNTKLDSLTGYVDQIEGRLIRTVDDTIYTVGDSTYNAWQQLKTLTGYVDGLEASSLAANSLLGDLVGHVDGVESTLSSMLHWLQVDAYGDQDVYSIMSGMVYNFVYGTAAQQTVIQSVWDKYWLTEEQMLAATFRVQLSADDLRDMQRRFNEAGIPTEVRYLEDAGIYVLRSAGNARAVDFDDFSQNQSQVSGLNTYPRFFSNAGCLYYAAEVGSATSLHNLNGKMGTVIQRLDTLIANQGQDLEANVTVDLGDITISSDDTTLTAYIKMLAYGQQDMYSSLAAIAAEYRDASASDKTAMDKILLNYWYTPGSNIGQVYFSGDALRSIHQHMVEIGYPCLVVWDSSLEAYVIKLTGNPRVSDVFDFSYTGAYSGKQNLYQDGTVYYLTQGGYLLSSRNDGTEASIDSMAANLNTLLNDHQAALLGALDGLSSDLFTYSEGERFLLDGILTQADELVFGQSDMLERMDTIIEHLSANIGDGGCDHVYVSEIEQEQTCILPGLQTFTCDECGSSYSEILESLGHDWQCTGHVEDELDPESGEVVSSGYDIYTCSRCEDTYHDYEGTGTPEAESNTIAGLIGRVFEKIGSLIGELLAAAVRMLDKLVTGFDDIVTSFNEKTQQIVSFGGTYPAWLAGVWDVVPSDLQLALTFCMIVFCLGVIGKKFAFTS